MKIRGTLKLVCFKLLILIVLGIIYQCNPANKHLRITDTIKSPQTNFALAELDIIQKRIPIKGNLRIQIDTIHLKPQAYQIKKENSESITVLGGDALGAMYGILDITEQLSHTNSWDKIEVKEEAPFIEKRGIKYNIPLDARLHSYDDTGDAAQNNIKEMWDADFWHEYLDNLARNRYNVLSLWTKHPFPSLIKLKDFPKVALDDVYAFNGEITPETSPDWKGIDTFDPKNLKLVKKMTIDEKIAFWQHVMQYAHDRGIEIYLFTWNIFVIGAEQYGITAFDEKAVPYMRTCVKEFALTYPHLAGMGVTAGETMGLKVGDRTNVEWLYDTYGKGIADALEADPTRSIRFIFRRHHTNLPDIQRDFTAHFPGKVETSFKYSAARMYSTTTPPKFDIEYADDVEKYGYKTWMNMRNDDVFTFRWGDPDYVRAYLSKMATYPIAGFYIGSDGYVWGREFTSKNPNLSGELEVKKHWYREMLWGRLAYNPELDKTFFEEKLKYQFPEIDASKLYDVWQNASKIIPSVNNFHHKGGDYAWAVEGCISKDRFQSVRDMIDCHPFEREKIMTIPEYARSLVSNVLSEKLTPIQIGDSLLSLSSKSLQQLNVFKADLADYSEALKETLADIEATAYLGEYYGHKIKGATYLYLYEAANDKLNYRTKALNNIKKALYSWELYANNADERYKVQLLARTRHLDWKALTQGVKNDIEIVEESNGKLAKVAKIYCYTQTFTGERDKLAKALRKIAYQADFHEPFQLGGYVNYTSEIVITPIGGRVFLEFKNNGGILPEDYNAKGYAIIKKDETYWIIGKDAEYTAKGIETFTRSVDSNQF